MGSTLLGLPEDTMLDAIGVAYASCSGNVQPTVEGAWSLWTPALLGQLGERNEITNVSLKPYPTCKYTHHAIATALRLVEAHGVTAEQVKRVTVSTNTMGATQCGFDATGAPKTSPETASAAKFSIPFTVAAAIVRRRVTLAEFTEASIREPALRQLAGRIDTRIDPAKDALPMLYPPMDVTIETTDGRVLSGCEEFVKGDPRNPFTFEDCVERFMAAAASATRPLLADDLQRFVTMVESLEGVKDAAELMPLLGGDRP